VRLGNIAGNGDVVGLLLFSADAMFLNNISRFLSNMPPIPDDVICGVASYVSEHSRMVSYIPSHRSCLLDDPEPPSGKSFVIQDAPPDEENAFTDLSHRYRANSTFVFHGTTLDRLNPILQNGLRMRTNAGDRKIGDSYGNGVYTTTNIETARGYAQVNLASSTPNELG
jgi:hypothetical protein